MINFCILASTSIDELVYVVSSFWYFGEISFFGILVHKNSLDKRSRNNFEKEKSDLSLNSTGLDQSKVAKTTVMI